MIFLVAALVLAADPEGGAPPASVAVIVLANQGLTTEGAANLAAEVAAALTKSGWRMLLDPSAAKAAVGPNANPACARSPDCLPQLTKPLNASLVVTLEFAAVLDEIAVAARVVDGKTGTPIAERTEVVRATALDATLAKIGSELARSVGAPKIGAPPRSPPARLDPPATPGRLDAPAPAPFFFGLPRPSPAALGVGAGAAATGIAFGVLQVLHWRTTQDLEGSLIANTDPLATRLSVAGYDQMQGSADNQLLWARVSAAAFAVLTGTATYLWLSSPR